MPRRCPRKTSVTLDAQTAVSKWHGIAFADQLPPWGKREQDTPPTRFPQPPLILMHLRNIAHEVRKLDLRPSRHKLVLVDKAAQSRQVDEFEGHTLRREARRWRASLPDSILGPMTTSEAPRPDRGGQPGPGRRCHQAAGGRHAARRRRDRPAGRCGGAVARQARKRAYPPGPSHIWLRHQPTRASWRAVTSTERPHP